MITKRGGENEVEGFSFKTTVNFLFLCLINILSDKYSFRYAEQYRGAVNGQTRTNC